MHPIGWKHIKEPSSAPTSDTSPPKTGIVEAMMYAISEMAKVQDNQVSQWRGELEVR
jgi:hypothetical protein